jgi:amidase
MSSKITRRDALKLGTSTALSAAATPLLSSSIARSAAVPGYAMPQTSDEICFMRAVDMVDAIRSKKVSSREVMQAHLKQIHQVNARVNAMVTLVDEEQLMAQAAAADEALANGKWLGPLHGLPVAVKDLHETRGIRTTFGSPLHKDYVPDFDCRVVQREKEAGAIVLGKSNVPELGLGSQTFNPIFGATHNGVRHGSSRGRQRHGGLAAQSSEFLQYGGHSHVAGTRA